MAFILQLEKVVFMFFSDVGYLQEARLLEFINH